MTSVPRSFLVKIWWQHKSIIQVKHHCFCVIAPERHWLWLIRQELRMPRTEKMCQDVLMAASTHKCKCALIGKSLHPYCSKGVHFVPVNCTNKKAWITRDIFSVWFQTFVPAACVHCWDWLITASFSYSLTTVLLLLQLKFS